MNIDLTGQTAVVTGAGRGIGLAVTSALSASGARVIAGSLHSSSELDKLAADGSVLAHQVDLAGPGGPAELVGLAGDRIDILVNYAGVSQPDRIMEVTQERYDLVMNVNVRGTMNMCQAVIPHMRSRKTGNIVNIGSVAAQRGGGLFGGPHYSASKGAVQSMAKSMARELGPDNIRVNAIAPGTIDTDIFAGKLTDEKKKQIAAEVPLGRLGTADDIAKACLFLVCDLSGYITGSVLDVNGGLLIHQ